MFQWQITIITHEQSNRVVFCGIESVGVRIVMTDCDYFDTKNALKPTSTNQALK
jgi:hypothetical protein